MLLCYFGTIFSIQWNLHTYSCSEDKVFPNAYLGRGNYKLRMKILGLGFLFLTQKIKLGDVLIGVPKWRGTKFLFGGSYRGSKLAPLAISTRCGLSGSKLNRKKNKRTFFLVKEAQLKQVPVLLFFFVTFWRSNGQKHSQSAPFPGFGRFEQP